MKRVIIELLTKYVSVANRHPTGFKSRTINASFDRVYPRLSLPKRLSIQTALMGGADGDSWANYYFESKLSYPPKRGEASIGSLDFCDASPLLSEVHRFLTLHPESVVIQIGASSGREIAEIAKTHPRCTAIYTDIDETIALGAKARFPTQMNLQFEVCLAHEIARVLSKLSLSGNLLIISSGSLQYVHPEHLKPFFDSIAGESRCAVQLALIEPGKLALDSDQLTHLSDYRGHFSYTHNYRKLAESVGFETKEWKVIRPYLPVSEFGKRANTIHLYGWFSRQ